MGRVKDGLGHAFMAVAKLKVLGIGRLPASWTAHLQNAGSRRRRTGWDSSKAAVSGGKGLDRQALRTKQRLAPNGSLAFHRRDAHHSPPGPLLPPCCVHRPWTTVRRCTGGPCGTARRTSRRWGVRLWAGRGPEGMRVGGLRDCEAGLRGRGGVTLSAGWRSGGKVGFEGGGCETALAQVGVWRGGQVG